MASLKSVVTFPAPAREGRPTATALREQYIAVRNQTDSLAAPLSAEDQMVQSCPEASPSKWHLAHTSWFFETFLLTQHLKEYRPFHPQFRTLFNSYYNAVSMQPEKALRDTFSRPALEEIQKYRRYIDEHMALLLESDALPPSVLDLVELGINHEQQHQELLVTDIKHAFWVNPLRPAYQANAVASADEDAAPQRPQSYEEGVHEVGASGDNFHFDSEGPHHKVYV